MTIAQQILAWLADGSQERHEIEARARTSFGIRDAATTSTRVTSALLALTRRGLVALHPVRGFCITTKGRKATEAP